MKELIEFKTVMPANTYKAYLKEADKYDLYCGLILIAVGMYEADLYLLIQLLKGI